MEQCVAVHFLKVYISEQFLHNMDVLTYIIMLFLSFCGLIIGIIISNIAVEEITSASKYLKYLNIILVPLIFLIASYSLYNAYSLIFMLIIFVALILLRNRYNDVWTYSCMGALLYISTISHETLNVTVMIFIYGMSIATISASMHYKKKINGSIKHSEKISLIKRILCKYSYYLLVGIIFFAAFNYVL